MKQHKETIGTIVVAAIGLAFLILASELQGSGVPPQTWKIEAGNTNRAIYLPSNMVVEVTLYNDGSTPRMLAFADDEPEPSPFFWCSLGALGGITLALIFFIFAPFLRRSTGAALLLLCAVTAQGADDPGVFWEPVEHQGTNYLLKYRKTGGAGIPATNPPGKPHYYVDIELSRDGKVLGNAYGQWVDGHCFDADPQRHAADCLTNGIRPPEKVWVWDGDSNRFTNQFGEGTNFLLNVTTNVTYTAKTNYWRFGDAAATNWVPFVARHPTYNFIPQAKWFIDLEHVELGLRDDGTVIWRERK